MHGAEKTYIKLKKGEKRYLYKEYEKEYFMNARRDTGSPTSLLSITTVCCACTKAQIHNPHFHCSNRQWYSIDFHDFYFLQRADHLVL